MAKELPYYKFEPNQWENGNIQMCTHEQKGVFVDLCSMYWSRLGEVPYKLAVQKICAGNANALDSLIENEIFEVIDGNIFIKFLSEQLNEFENTSERNSKIAKEGWQKRRKQREESERNANALQSQSDGNAIREEEIREEEIRENNKNKFNFKKALLDYGFHQNLISEWLIVRKKKKASNTETAFQMFIKEVEASGMDKNEVLAKCVSKSWAGFEKEWIKPGEKKTFIDEVIRQTEISNNTDWNELAKQAKNM